MPPESSVSLPAGRNHCHSESHRNQQKTKQLTSEIEIKTVLRLRLHLPDRQRTRRHMAMNTAGDRYCLPNDLI